MPSALSPRRTLARLPALVRFLLALVAVNVAVYATFRLCFWATYREASADVAWTDVLTALYLGLKFDLRLALVLCLPVALLGWIAPFDPTRSRVAQAAWIGYFSAAQFVVLLLYFVDLGHYGYLGVRLNASLLEHLTPVAVAAQMAWETYPVLPALLGVLLLGFGYAWLVRGAARRTLKPVTEPLGKWSRRAALGTLAAFYVLGVWGAWSLYPLRWSAAYFAGNEAVAALALNPVLFLADTMPNRSRTYDTRKVREHYAYMASLLGIMEPRPQDLDFARYIAPPSNPAARYNLVVIHMESLAAFQLGIFGNPLNATPHFDAVARDGILFTNFFVPQGPTARSVFTLLTGIPDLNPNRTASRNPLLVSQHTLVNALDGYDKFYFLNGSATWGNIRGLLANNIPDLRMFEEGDYDAPYDDTWGVSDLVLFEKAHQTFSAAREPFFAFIQTSGNHRPYTIPKDRRGFELAEVDDAALRANGFDNLVAYNGLRLLDYSLESFFARARRSPYFQRTVFVMYGDHGVASPTATPWAKIGLTAYHVPLVIYAPWLFEQGNRRNRGARRRILPAGAAGGGTHLFRYRSEAPAQEVHAQYPEKVAALRRLQEALYETALYLLYHNPPRVHTPQARRER